MLRKETVEPGTLELLKSIVSLPEFGQFRLVGGTALSLIYGHRKSIDLDLFTDKPFDKELIVETLLDNFKNVTVVNERLRHIYQCVINEVRVDLVAVRDPFLHDAVGHEGIPFAHIADLVALKLNAVKGRGVKKDFFDVAKLLEFYTLEELFNFYVQRYPNDDTFAVIRSIIYFTDAEDTVTPETLDGTTWESVKQTIINAFDQYYKSR